MKIETLTEWNNVSTGCGCCPMPTVDPPTKDCEGITGDSLVGAAVTVVISPSIIQWWKISRDDYSGGGFYDDTSPSNHWTSLGGVALEPINVVRTSGDPRTGTMTTTRSSEVTASASRAAGLAAINSAVLDWEAMTTHPGMCESELRHYDPVYSPSYQTLYVVFSRFRWVVPSSHLGIYFKITWDVLTTPTGEGAPTLATDSTWEWTGPGNPADDDSWKSPWFHLGLPDVPATRKIVNVRYIGYRSTRVGSRPQLTGEGYEIPL